MSDPLRFIPPRVPIVDPKTGIITREWYLFLQGVFLRIGGADGQSTTDLSASQAEDAGVEEIKATTYTGFDAINQSPPASLVPQDQILEPPRVDIPQVDALMSEVRELRDTVAELVKTIQGIQQGPSF